ncbi:receptor activity-modifying protein 1, partial [Clarias magur]
MGIRGVLPARRHAAVCVVLAALSAVAMACNSYYEDAIKELCLAKFKEDMEALDQGHWCSWEDTV